jgi:hypothetical protein
LYDAEQEKYFLTCPFTDARAMAIIDPPGRHPRSCRPAQPGVIAISTIHPSLSAMDAAIAGSRAASSPSRIRLRAMPSR